MLLQISEDSWSIETEMHSYSNNGGTKKFNKTRLHEWLDFPFHGPEEAWKPATGPESMYLIMIDMAEMYCLVAMFQIPCEALYVYLLIDALQHSLKSGSVMNPCCR